MIERIRSIGERARKHADGNQYSVAYLLAELAEVLEQVVLAEQCRETVQERRPGSDAG